MENKKKMSAYENYENMQKYLTNYADAKYVPLTSVERMRSFFDTHKTSLDKTITQEKVALWLSSVERNYTNLIDASKTLYRTSGEYKSLLNYFIDMARFYYEIEPKFSSNAVMTKDKVKKDLSKISLQLEKMNLKHELAKVFKTCVIEDIYFGYEVEDKDNYFLLKLDPKYCRISGISDGMYTFEFNLSFFSGREQLVNSYPEEFRQAYKQYQVSNKKKIWFTPDFTKSVCFKFNEDIVEIFPPFAVMFEPLLDMNDYKKLKKAGAKINNYMLLHQKVPMFENNKGDYTPDNFSISTDSMDFFNAMVNENLPPEIGAIVSPMEIEPIELNKNDNGDKVLEASRDVYNASGVSAFLFNNDKNSTGGLSYSVRKDELRVISFYRQVERWLNRKIRFGDMINKSNWKISLLNVTGLSEDKLLEDLIKAGSLGFPVRGKIAALHGQDYHTLYNAVNLENEILDLDINMVPLASTHTGGMNSAMEKANGDQGGRPVKSAGEISDSGQSNKDSGAIPAKGGE